MDDLVKSMQSTQVDSNSMGDHPRYSMFKNAGKAADAQAARRSAALERQKEGRIDYVNKMRKLAYEDEESDDEELEEEEDVREKGESVEEAEMQTVREEESRERPKYTNRYANTLMTSEWLVDIPSTLDKEWTMMISPKGKRVLVVASKGVTTIYDKNGRKINQCPSHLPGGGGTRKGNAAYTIMDCIMTRDGTNTIYCLDLLCWNEAVIADSPFDFRLFFLKSRLEEIPELAESSRRCKYRYVVAPSCPCDSSSMKATMEEDFGVQVDGLLFYYNQGIYTPGQSPLVGWLKPWMLPEILGVEVPSSYHVFNTSGKQSAEYIKAYNTKHGHTSKVNKVEGEGEEKME